MKNKVTKTKLSNKITLFSILFLLLNGIPHLAFSQYVPLPQKLEPAKIRPTEQDKHYIPSQSFPPDFISPQNKIKGNKQPVDTAYLKKNKKATPTNPPHKLPRTEIKKIVGNDKVLGKDSQGHRLYREPHGEIYYLSNTGTKVLIFLIIAS